MSMSADLRDRWRDANVASGQVYRDERPQGSALPALRMQVVTDPRPMTHDGFQALRSTRVQADCMGASRAEADQVAEAAISVAASAGTHGETKFSRSFVDGSRTYSDRADDGVVTYVTSLDLIVWHQPAA